MPRDNASPQDTAITTVVVAELNFLMLSGITSAIAQRPELRLAGCADSLPVLFDVLKRAAHRRGSGRSRLLQVTCHGRQPS